MKFTAVFATLLAAALSVAATPLETRDVFVPPITSPSTGTVWTSGQTQTVTWDASNPPAHITNPLGMIVVVKDKVTTPIILAENFDILLGHIEITVPLVFEGSDYQLMLLGDSTNLSPDFTIQGSGVSFDSKLRWTQDCCNYFDLCICLA
ncbi:hypothetical protein FB45DRAFT_1005053 [Roridomyces roridus]|uniref:Yeast cell wall synthesis Kre9/Knh1-like N-terminal domain-containing protein n=1 Tax=Roridomyces roridus TaxID=1738132 RepID=A0AAD7BN43_9AGAR|nr:hypothetical protein FB45DRAFT_1005053 [Roridomyces roridus]